MITFTYFQLCLALTIFVQFASILFIMSYCRGLDAGRKEVEIAIKKIKELVER